MTNKRKEICELRKMANELLKIAQPEDDYKYPGDLGITDWHTAEWEQWKEDYRLGYDHPVDKANDSKSMGDTFKEAWPGIEAYFPGMTDLEKAEVESVFEEEIISEEPSKKQQIFQELAELLSGAHAGITFVPKSELEDEWTQKSISESDDPAQYIYELGIGSHFDINMPGTFEMAADGRDVIIQFGGLSDQMTYEKLSDLIKKLESGEWLIFGGKPEPEDPTALIFALRAVQDKI